MILQSLPRHLPQLSFKTESSLAIALGENDEALCYLAKAHALGADGYAVHFMTSSLMLDRILLHGPQPVSVNFALGAWMPGELSLMPKWREWPTHPQGMVTLFLQIFAEGSDGSQSGHAPNLQT